MTTNIQPQYWLQVRSEYIIENFDSLVKYLRNYNYSPEHQHIDFDNTLDCMMRLCADLGNNICSTPLYKPLNLPYDNETVLKLLCATILAEKMAGQSMYNEVVSLCALLLHMRIKIDMRQIFDKLIACMRHRRIVSTGFVWDNIVPRNGGEFNLNFFTLAFYRMSFEPDNEGATFYTENNGTIMLPPNGGLNIYVGNRDAFARGKAELQFSLQEFLNIYHHKGEMVNTDDFTALATLAHTLDAEQAKMKPAVRVAHKEYDEDDVFAVRITEKRGIMIKGCTIDSRYSKLEGKILIQLYENRPSIHTFINMLKTGDILLVSRHEGEGYAFEVTEAFEDFYRHYSADAADDVVDAIYQGWFPSGTKWVSRDGIRLSLPKQKVLELDPDAQDRLESVINTRSVVSMHLYKNPPAMDAVNFNVYCQPAEDMFFDWAEEAPEPFTQEDADRNMIEAYLEYCNEEIEELPEMGEYTEADTDMLRVLPLLFHSLGMDRRDNVRMWYLADLAAMMLSRVCDMTDYHDYLEAELDYIFQLAQFAAGEQVRMPEMPTANDNEAEIQTRMEIIRSLEKYRKPQPLASSNITDDTQQMTEEQRLANVRALVYASNSLVDIIDIEELDNIKKAIAKLLGAADEYESILDNRTFYGKENVTLEFKTSVVYPAENLRRDTTITADPEIQKWVILKAVCGMLNSRNGGDLLIGVNDAGYAVGLKEDINHLYKAGLIYHPDMDHYMTYLNNMFDTAFRERGVDSEGYQKDIARECIEVSEEDNAEDRPIIKVHIKPYRKRIVEFAPGNWRPDWVAGSYERKYARTIPLP